MSVQADQVVELLNRLGATPDEVARTLTQEECVGARSDCYNCPVAVYLLRHTGAENVVVGLYTAEVHYRDGFVRAALPLPVRYFIDFFDSGDEFQHLAGSA